MIILGGQIDSPDVIIDHAKCDLCANCTRTCPMGVLKIINRTVVRREAICIGCRNCQVSCLPGAIRVTGQHRILTGDPAIGFVPLKNYPPYSGLTEAKNKLVASKT